ncbi:MAG: LysR family transcriptional regulator [Myxococcota bacterium]
MRSDSEPLRLEDLQAFVAVTEAGSLTGAARRTGIPKSTLIRRIRRLEEGLGLRMLTRTARSAHPTFVGSESLARIRGLLEDAEGVRAELMGHGEAPRGRLRVSAPADLAHDDELWLSFMERYPDVELHLDLTNRFVNVAHEGFDVALRGRRGEDERLVAQRIGDLDMVAVASPGWVELNGVLTTPADFMSVDCLLLKEFVSETPQSTTARHRVCNQLSVVRQGALRGLGVAILPWHGIHEDLRAGTLVPVLEGFNPLTVPMYAVYPDRRFVPASTRALLVYLREAFEQRRSEIRPNET